ncbi:PH domain-containing protein [Aeromicrobium sp.]|uniref:PH domain-containing protein n=1 Tax=Aeromicrobium sp. TaxID=1871063 RepID=UPI003C4274D7
MAPDSEPTHEPIGLRTHPLTGLVQGALWAAAASVGLVSSVFSRDGWGAMSSVLSLLVALVGGLLLGMGFGFGTWAFTRYVIDGTELRISSGVITKASRRIPYERLQSVDIAEPLVARLLGLAELRIEMAGGKDSRTSLRFLRLADAQDLRRVLLAKAHGDTAATVEQQRTIITVVPPQRVVIGTLLSLDFLLAAFGSVILLGGAIWFDQVIVLLGGIIPLGTWLIQIVGKRVLQQWDFTLSRGADGLRIERGLLSRTSQTIPFARVQGIAVREPYVWRRFGWQRLEVDVAGFAAHGDDDSTASSSTLLPITDGPLADAIIAELIPGSAVASVPAVPAPRRSWLFAPIGWRYRWVGANQRTFVARQGWIQRTTSIVPHHKTQSVELRQGPIQRRRHVATLEVHSPQGPVDADGRHLDEHDARTILFEQLERARAARG